MKRFVLVLCLAMILAWCCGGCSYDRYYAAKKYPWFKAEEWYCAEIDMTIRYVLDEDGELVDCPASQLEWNGQVYDVVVGLQSSWINFSILTEESAKTKILSHDASILDGTWAYRDGNLVITDFDEPFWEGKYSELVFVPQ